MLPHSNLTKGYLFNGTDPKTGFGATFAWYEDDAVRPANVPWAGKLLARPALVTDPIVTLPNEYSSSMPSLTDYDEIYVHVTNFGYPGTPGPPTDGSDISVGFMWAFDDWNDGFIRFYCDPGDDPNSQDTSDTPDAANSVMTSRRYLSSVGQYGPITGQLVRCDNNRVIRLRVKAPRIVMFCFAEVGPAAGQIVIARIVPKLARR